VNAAVLRAGLIGLGQMGSRHARILQALDGVVLAGALDPGGDRYRAAGGIPLAAGVDELIRLGLDYAVLACPTLLHEPIGTALAAAGVPALIEKPLAGDPAAAWRLAEAFRSAGVPAGVGYTERFSPALAALRQRVQGGQLGDVFSVATRRTGPYPGRITDTGVIHDLATHDLDLTAWITSARYTSITARTAHRSGRPHEDLLAALAQLSDGTIAHHQVSWVSPLKERTTTVTGDHGILIADTLTASLTYWANSRASTQPDHPGPFGGVAEGDMTRYAIPRHDPLASEHEAFRDLILGRPQRTATLHDGLHAVLTAHAALHASRTATTTARPHPHQQRNSDHHTGLSALRGEQGPDYPHAAQVRVSELNRPGWPDLTRSLRIVQVPSPVPG
jgi:UDP-N-acetylglucosamine 3-dehydrogenase